MLYRFCRRTDESWRKATENRSSQQSTFLTSNTDSIAETGDHHVAETSFPVAKRTAPTDHHGLSSGIWDRLGIAGSLLCVVHCALTPLFIGYLTAMGLGVLGDEIVHKVLAIVLLAVAVFAFIPGYKRHANVAVIAAGASGVAFIVTGGLLLGHFIPHGAEIALTVIGSLLLIGAHTANWRLSGCSSDCASPRQTGRQR